MTSPTGDQNHSIGDLFVDVSKDLSLLVRQEVELAKAEVRQSAKSAGKGAGMLSGAAVTAHLGVLFLSLGVWWALGEAIGRGWSGLVVGAVYLVVAAALAAVGRKDLRAVSGLPRTTSTVGKIPAAMKGNEDVR